MSVELLGGFKMGKIFIRKENEKSGADSVSIMNVMMLGAYCEEELVVYTKDPKLANEVDCLAAFIGIVRIGDFPSNKDLASFIKEMYAKYAKG